MFSEPRHETTSRGHLAILLCVAGVLAAAAVLSPVRTWVGHRKRSVAEYQEARLSLQAQLEGRRMRVVWDRNAPILSQADAGLLSIRDGAFARSIPLTASQLRDQNDIIYSPSSTEVELKLEVSGAKIAKQSQSVLVVLGPRRSADAEEEQPPAIEAEVVEDVPAMRTARAAPPARLVPAVIVRQRSGQGIPSGSYQPAVPLNEIRAAMPGQAEALITEPVEIEVRVTIDARGKVTAARPVSQTGSFSGSPAQQALITRALLDAASNCAFRPAEINSRPVPAELTLAFRFPGRN